MRRTAWLATSSGCFGFNTHLKKLRPIFAAATVLWFGRWAWRDFGVSLLPRLVTLSLSPLANLTSIATAAGARAPRLR